MTTTSPNKGFNIGAIVIIAIAVAINLVIAKLMATWSYSWFPPQASTAAPYVDDLFALETGIGKPSDAFKAWTSKPNRSAPDEEIQLDSSHHSHQQVIWATYRLQPVFFRRR